jgi:hypothetical protein
MKTALDYLFRIEPPWIYVGSGEAERTKWIPSCFYSREEIEVCVRRLRGKKMRTTAALMNEFAASLQFFEGFGENWYALGECLNYLDEWLPADAYVLVVEGAEELLKDEQPEQMAALMKTLHEAGEWWSKPIAGDDPFNRNGIPFHVLLNVAETEPSAADRICNIAAQVKVPVRR